MSVVNSPVQEGELFHYTRQGGPREMAIYLLGRLRAEEAVEDLMEWLTPRPGQAWLTEPVRYSPAGRALIEIGLPSVRPLAELVRLKANTRNGQEAIALMMEIKGKEEAQLMFARMADEEQDPEKRRNLQAAVEVCRSCTRPLLSELREAAGKEAE